MKTLLLSAIAFLLFIAPIQAQEYPGCFALDDQGNYIDLNYLCNIPEPEPETEPIIQSIDALYESSYYAGYCSAIEQGKTKEEADEDGMNLAITRIRAIGHSVGDISNPTFVRIVQIENGDIPCPD